MYEEFYGLKQRPFTKTPDPKFLFLSKNHEEALARLQYAVEEKELILLTGEVGSGKTTLTRALMDSLGEKYRVILIINPRLTPVQFLRTVAKRFNMDVPYNFKDNLLDTIYEKVYKDYETGISPVIIIDEAQLIPNKDTFEEIRLLTNFQLDYTNLLSLILVGQTDLRRRLNHKTYLPLRQRIGLFYHLRPLTESDIRGYVEHRLRVSGMEETLFTDGALKRLYQYSCGIPRVINSLATSALLDGFGKELRIIDESLIKDAAKELGLNGYREN
ncbi:MAG: ATPase [Nitrospirae bacterium CG02_land_8_20_14_3_00_41_53]|nr:MAG: ATPase [Nitrospirae bacterium CG11_big_fil_rev_8_21_14_0_20_41_14]PIV42631.1 MAG: ATPase [Nitrospirae bacterium CG02_land_8_20_14_3_00_41_53]PIW87198.1 MAG: ATPase [Nitrospirae bacterium CG_4_8_14_3_um_filter_41_47]